MKTITYTIADPLGIHARPAGLLVQTLQGFSSKAVITRGADESDGKKLLALMKLRVKTGETLAVTFDGPDEEEAAIVAEAFLKENL